MKQIRVRFNILWLCCLLWGTGPVFTQQDNAVDWPRLSCCPSAIGDVIPIRIDLCGTWQFDPSPDSQSPDNHSKPIHVPGEWAMQGFDVAEGTAALYTRQFDVPGNWRDLQIKLRCEAIYSRAKIWINNRFVGEHLGGFTPFEFDITEYITIGSENEIRIAVQCDSVADALAAGSKYAAHPLGGITRNIGLFAAPKINLASLHTATRFDAEYNNATLQVSLDIANETGSTVNDLQVEFDLRSTDGKKALFSPKSVTLPSLDKKSLSSRIVEIAVNSPDKWDPEHPNLYFLECTMRWGGKVQAAYRKRFGFRQVEVRHNQLFFNNHPVKLRGICRHDTHPLMGRSVTARLCRQDAELFKNANINYVRTSHYPPNENFIDACDELGIMVEEEAPFCWVGYKWGHPFWAKHDKNNPKYLAPILTATLEMIRRDFSHPCIVIWSLANESDWSPNFQHVAEIVAKADPTRPRTFNWLPWKHTDADRDAGFCQIHADHYPGPEGPLRIADHDRPVLFDEYCHLYTYNRRELMTDPGLRDRWGIGFSNMWEKMLASQGCLGGAIWCGIDDIFYLPDGKTVGYGQWGPLDGWRRTKPEYWHIKKTYSPIKINLRELDPPSDDSPLTVLVQNRFFFTNLNEIKIKWSLFDTADRVVESGLTDANIDPGCSGTIRIPSHKHPQLNYLTLQCIDSQNRMVDTYKLLFKKPLSQNPVNEVPLQWSENEQIIRVRQGDGRWLINRQTGKLTGAQFRQHPVLIGGPHLMLLPLEETRGHQLSDEPILPLNTLCSDWQPSNIVIEEKDNNIFVHVEGTCKEVQGTFIYQWDKAGKLTIRYDCTCLEPVKPRQIGLVFDLPKQFDTLSWKRRALWSVYPDDYIGRPEGTAKAFLNASYHEPNKRTEPRNNWSLDETPWGSNDFRSSKTSVLWASLTSDNATNLQIFSNGTQTIRAWVNQGQTHLMIADVDNGGGDSFFARHENQPRLEKGSRISGAVTLSISENTISDLQTNH